MMQDIDQAIELYKLMAKRCLDSGFAPYQGQVYTEMSDFMSDCTSAEEAMMKIKNSKYYLAPSVALMKDKLTALKNAALSHSMPIVADIYQHKLNEIDQNPAAIYETGYEKDAQNQKIKYIQTLEGFSQMYLSYIEICCSPANDAAKIEGGKNGINQGKSKLSLPSDDFATLAQNSIFRDLLSIEDAGYADFVQNVLAWSSNEKNYEDELIEVNRETEIQWPLVKAQKTAILAIGQSFTKKTALVTVISPTDKNGVYAYIDEEVVENA